jgi:hypothetical protein
MNSRFPTPASHNTHRQRGEGGRPVGNNTSSAASTNSTTGAAHNVSQATAAAPGRAPGRVTSP